MISIKTLIFNPFQENTYLLYDHNKKCIIIDAGCYDEEEFNKLSNFIDSHDLTPERLICTHGHVDHVLGNIYISRKYNLKAELHVMDAGIIKKAVDFGKMVGIKIIEPPAIEKFLNDGDVIYLGESSLEVRHVPGHSPGSVALYCSDYKFVITGDALFKGSIGRTDLPGGNYNDLISSIKNKLLTLDNDVVVYPGHGPTTSIGIEKTTNPFLI